jgi:3-hydroxybutyryl-CoA dehydrogenase
MGTGIAQVFASHGYEVTVFDPSESAHKNSAINIAESLDHLVKKGRMSQEEAVSTQRRCRYTKMQDECVADVIIEAVVENEEIKCTLINELLAINGTSTIIASNTSSLSLTAIAEKITSPERFAGLHFFNPAPVMKLVEIVHTQLTDPGVVESLVALASSVGKVAVKCKDTPGFIVNRVARPYYIESLYLLEKTDVKLQTIDVLLESTGFPMGPFRLMDLIGNDVNYSVSCIVYEALNKPERLKPSTIQKNQVEQGRLGRKTGKGFYEYTR